MALAPQTAALDWETLQADARYLAARSLVQALL
jgi:beta-N-acetylhexosaminidase